MKIPALDFLMPCSVVLLLSLPSINASAETQNALECPPGYETGRLGSLNLRSESIQVEILNPIQAHPRGYYIRLRVTHQKSAFKEKSLQNTARFDVHLYDDQDDQSRALRLSNQLGDEFSSRRIRSLCVRSLDPKWPHPNRPFRVRYGMELDASIGDPGVSLY